MHPVLQVFLFAALTALATGLGAIPFLFTRRLGRTWLGVANAIASGLMLGASFGLIYEGFSVGDASGVWRTLGGVTAGLAFITFTRTLMPDPGKFKFAGLQQIDARKAALIVGVMTIHSAAEGVGVGVAFGEGEQFGLLITIAIAVHNIPEGLAISLVMVPRGTSIAAAALWSIFSSLPQPILAVPAYLFVEQFQLFLPVGLGFAAGAMMWMVFTELLPESLEDASPNTVAIVATLSVVAMQGFVFALE